MASTISKAFLRSVLWGIVVAFAGCSSTHAPRGVLSKPAKLQTEAYGGWIRVELSHDFKEPLRFVVAGELLAANADSLFVLAEDSFHAFPVAAVTKARLVVYDSQAGSIGGPAIAAGSLTTLTHGFWLVLTSPILWWIAAGSAVGSRSREPMMNYPARPMADFRQYARFPQGLPPTLDRHALQRKPVRKRMRRKR